jgi:hypothetical protein
MKDHFVDNFVIFEYTILHCRALCICTRCNQIYVSFFSRSFLTIIESILGKIQIITPHQTMFLFIKKKINTYARVKNMYKWWPRYCKWLTTIVCIHFCQNYLTELPIKLNPLLPIIRISDNSKFCNGPVNFEITRFTCIYFWQFFCEKASFVKYVIKPNI